MVTVATETIPIPTAATAMADTAIRATLTVATAMADMEILAMPMMVMETVAMGNGLTTVMVTLMATVLSSGPLSTGGTTGAITAVDTIGAIINSMGGEDAPSL